WGLINWVVPAEQLEARLEDVLEQTAHASRTAVALSKQLLLESFHRDPRTMIDDLVAAEMACYDSWELQAANDASSRTGADHRRFIPRPAGQRQRRESMRTRPFVPWTVMVMPSLITSLPTRVPTTHGRWNSRATIAQWLRMPPESATMPLTVANSGTH